MTLERFTISPPPDAETFLASCDVFGALPPQVRHAVQQELTWSAVPGKTSLVTRGAMSDSVHVVYSGTLRVIGVNPDGSASVWRDHHRGDMLGEAGVMTGLPRSATIVAVRNSVVASLDAVGFRRLVDEHPSVGASLATMLSHRLIARTPPPRTFRFVAGMALGSLAMDRSRWDELRAHSGCDRRLRRDRSGAFHRRDSV
jgi:hypothetical protein